MSDLKHSSASRIKKTNDKIGQLQEQIVELEIEQDVFNTMPKN